MYYYIFLHGDSIVSKVICSYKRNVGIEVTQQEYDSIKELHYKNMQLRYEYKDKKIIEIPYKEDLKYEKQEKENLLHTKKIRELVSFSNSYDTIKTEYNAKKILIDKANTIAELENIVI